jgi:hypothetical protein
LADPQRLRAALAAIDAANAADPHRIDVRGESRPKELAHAQLATRWVEALVPGPSEALRLATRAHHLRRWESPRDAYPVGRAGYHRWRKDLQGFHARCVAEILEREGYDAATIARVEGIVQKRGLGSDPEVQALEDALCLVFIETQLGDFAERLEGEKLLAVIRKTLKKMSPEAVALARELPLDPEHARLIGCGAMG